MNDMPTMKYLRCHLLHAGLCLLLVCSANVASAQVMVSLSAPSINVIGTTIRFNVNLSRQLTGDELIESILRLENISSSEIESLGAVTNYPISRCNTRVSNLTKNLDFIVCMDAGEREVTVQLELDDSFSTTTAVTIILSSAEGLDVAGGVARDPDRATLNFIVHRFVRVRSKVFLEGPLQ